MALAPLAHVLWTRVMTYDAAAPDWPDRDRFVLSNGHASILLYSMLYLTGYGLTLDDLKAFRQWGSRTPGHPERGHTTGVEVTTGPLGQGFANGVGMGLAERWLRNRFGSDVVDHHTFVIAGDGCLEEGISHESASLAGHLGLGRLVYVYDDNHVTIDGPTELALDDDPGQAVRGLRLARRVRRARSPTTSTGSRVRCAGPWRSTTRRRWWCCAATSPTPLPTTPTTSRPTATPSRIPRSPQPRPPWASPTSRSGCPTT